MAKVFAFNTDDLLASVPDFWRSCLESRLTYDASQKREMEFYWRAPEAGHKKLMPEPVLKSKEDRKVASERRVTEDGEPLMHVGDGVSPPRATHTPEPEYTEIARYERFQGVAVVTIIVGSD